MVADGVDHHHLEQVLEIALKEFHQRLTQLRTGVARACFERGYVVLCDSEPARQLALREVMLVAHRAQADSTDFYVHAYNLRLVSVFVKS